MNPFGNGKTLKRLDEMVTEAINGTFSENNYNETELSRLESKWKQYLTTSKMSMEQTEKERENIKSMISDISHQTKTPLSNILLYSELLQEMVTGEEEQKIVQKIHAQTEKLEFLIQSLIKMSRLETNILEIKPIKQKIEPLISVVLDEIMLKAKQKDISIRLEGDCQREAVYDLKWTTEAFYNVMDNAVKYSKPNSEIFVFLKAYSFYCGIQVKDEGIGIKEAERAQIFERFYRSKEVQQKDGVGIGLYLAREILKKEKGYIKVESIYGKGSCFELCLLMEE